MSDQTQILRLLATIREETAQIRSRQEELYELLISYKDQIDDLKKTVVDGLAGLPKSPYIAGQLVPAPDRVDGVDEFRHVLATFLHRTPFPGDVADAPPEEVVYEPARAVKDEEIELEPDEDDRPRQRRQGGGGGGGRRDNDLERGPDRDIEPIDLDDDADEGDEDEGGEGEGEGKGGARRGGSKKRRRRRGRRDGAGKAEKVQTPDES